MTSQTAAIDVPRASSRPLPARSLVLLAGPVLVLASELAAPRQPDGMSAKREAAFLLAHQERFLVSGLLGLVSAAALAAGFTLVGLVLRDRGRWPARVSAVLGLLGAIGLAAHQTLTLAGRDILLDDATAYPATNASANGAGAVVTILALILGLNLAVVLLGVAARRARIAGGWVVAAGVLALVADFSPTSYNTVLWCVPTAAVLGAFALALREDPVS